MKYVVGITGASGSIYGKRLIESLVDLDAEIFVVGTKNGKAVFQYELGISLEAFLDTLKGNIHLEDIENLFSPIASGSFKYDGVIIAPCSMATLGAVSHGSGQNLLTRVCDVAMKEGIPLILLPRETPLSTLHLENMHRLSQYGVKILPAMPGFYQKPKTIENLVDFITGKIFDTLNIKHNLYKPWGESGDSNEKND